MPWATSKLTMGNLCCDTLKPDNMCKKTRPFKNASQYDMLTMEQLAPALGATADDVEAYNRDLTEHGVLTLEQVKHKYGLE